MKRARIVLLLTVFWVLTGWLGSAMAVEVWSKGGTITCIESGEGVMLIHSTEKFDWGYKYIKISSTLPSYNKILSMALSAMSTNQKVYFRVDAATGVATRIRIGSPS